MSKVTIDFYTDLPRDMLVSKECVYLNNSSIATKKMERYDRFRVTASFPEEYFQSKIDFDADIEEIKKV